MHTGANASQATDRASELDGLFRAQRGRLWGIAYRLTGSAADAEDVVQESFARLLAKPPARTDLPLAPWLARVATNLALDALRRRRRRRYDGPWLPAPVEELPPELEVAAPGADPERRYGLAESASYAFLLTLELLGPRQRAALLLRDVLGCSVRETAEQLGTSEANVRVLHLRARRAMADYDRRSQPPSRELQQRHRAALEQFMRCLLEQDAAGLEALLAESVRTRTDAGGEYTALTSELCGRTRVARFYLSAALQRRGSSPRFEIRALNGLSALLTTLEQPVRRQAPRSALLCTLDESGRICEIHVVLASQKLAGIRFP